MEFFVLPYCVNIFTWRKECIVSAIKNDALVPQFKFLNSALWYTCTLYYQTCKIISACAGKRWLLTCIQHTRRLIRVQHTKHYLHASYHCAAHKLLLACSARKIAHVQYTKFDLHAAHFVSHACLIRVTTKIEEHTRVHCMRVST